MDLLPPPPGGEVAAPLFRRAAEIFAQARAPNTVRAYAADWRDFTSWCVRHSFAALPATPGIVVLYLTDRSASAAIATLTRKLAAISQAHRAAEHESPARSQAVRLFLAGLRRERGSAPVSKRAILARDLRAMLAAAPDSLLGVRDRALLLTGYLGAFRRSELVALDAEDVEFTEQGVVLRLRRSKTDPEGKGEKKGIPRGRPGVCAVAVLRQWMEEASISSGAVFRRMDRYGRVLPARLSGAAVALVVKRYAGAAGLDPAHVAGHSLRAGLATAAAMAGKSERAIMRQTLHRSVATLRRYIRDGSLFRDNAADGIGL